jgi:hypothetical protein
VYAPSISMAAVMLDTNGESFFTVLIASGSMGQPER